MRAQRLAAPPRNTSVADTVAAVVGIQAQDEPTAALSIRARSRGLKAADVTTARAGDRSIVLTWTLRGTRHYHHHADVRWLVALLGPVFSKPSRRAEQLGIAGEVGDRAAAAVYDALAADGPLTRRVLAERLERHGVEPTGQAPIHVIRRAALQGLLCVVPGRDGGPERYALMDDWVPAAAPVSTEQAGAELARRYLAAFAPARPADFASWSGLNAQTVRAAWSAVGPELTEVETASDPAWVLTSGCSEPRPSRPAPLRLVGGFDTLLLGYADRTLHLAPEHARRVNAGGGIVRPAVIADGRVIGTWAHRRDRLEVRSFRALSPDERAELEREAADVGRFLGSDPALTVADT